MTSHNAGSYRSNICYPPVVDVDGCHPVWEESGKSLPSPFIFLFLFKIEIFLFYFLAYLTFLVVDVDGMWGEWEEWSSCSVQFSCQRGGIRRRLP